jgi:molecular chaperone GrpE
MSDHAQPEEDFVLPAAPEPLEGVIPDVAFIVPAAAYDTIATDDELARPLEPIPDRGADATMRTLVAVEALGEGLHEKLDRLQTLFDREIRAEATREKVVDRLHAELQEYKQDLLLNVLRPVFVDLIQLHDDIGKIVEVQNSGDGETERLLGLMRGFQQGIEDILYRQGVEPYANEGEVFDPRRQRAVATLPTEDPAANKTIAARHRKGFRTGEKIIRPEVVSVYALKK